MEILIRWLPVLACALFVAGFIAVVLFAGGCSSNPQDTPAATGDASSVSASELDAQSEADDDLEDDDFFFGLDEEEADELFATNDDEKLCSDVFHAIADITGNQLDVAKEPEPCRTVTLVLHSLGIIGNGGFQYLFEGNFNGDPGYRITAAAYENIQAEEAHAAFQDAFALFPNGELPDNVEERHRIFQSHPDDARHAINVRYYDAMAETERLLAKFIRSNKDAIRKFLTVKM